MGLPKVTIGQATGRRTPEVSFGRATSIPQPTLLDVRRPETRSVTLQQLNSAQVEVPTLVISELTGNKRVILLRGRALPHRPNFWFTSQQRIDEGEYTGYPRVNQTVLGGRELDSEFNGCWKDRFLGDPAGEPSASIQDFVPDGVAISADAPLSNLSPLLTAVDLCAIFEEITYAGRPLRFRWRHIRRIGRLEKFAQNPLNEHDIEWKMTFKWMSRDEQTGLPSPARTTLTSIAAEFNAAYTGVHEATNFDGLDGLDTRFADRIDAGVGRLQGAIADIEGAVETRVTAVSDLGSALQRATTIAAYTRDKAQELIDALDGVVYPAMLAAKDPSSVIPSGLSFDALTDVDFGQSGQLVESMLDVNPGAAIAAACQNRAAVRLARRMRHVAARQQFSAIRQLEAESIAVVVLRAQQDLRDVALEWYDNPDDWEQIRRFNSLDTVSPPPGTIVFIPNTATGRP